MPHYTANISGVTKPQGYFEAISFMPRRNKFLRTFHDTRAKAQRRLDGCPRHTEPHIVDHSPNKA